MAGQHRGGGVAWQGRGQQVGADGGEPQLIACSTPLHALTLLAARNGGQHHVAAVDGVDEVGGEGGALPLLHDGQVIIVLHQHQPLHGGGKQYENLVQQIGSDWMHDGQVIIVLNQHQPLHGVGHKCVTGRMHGQEV